MPLGRGTVKEVNTFFFELDLSVYLLQGYGGFVGAEGLSRTGNH
jgi:hypothetical protein